MPLEERKIDVRKKEMRIWLLISVVSAVVFVGLMINAVVHDIRFKYGFYIAVLTYVIMFISIVMYSFTQYISTREIVSILVGKIRGSGD
jgi:uncharacterized membrane protein